MNIEGVKIVCSECALPYVADISAMYKGATCALTNRPYYWRVGDAAVPDTANPKDILGTKKPPVDLVPPAALLYMSKVMGLGATKYGPYNWRSKKVKYTVYIAAAMRHLMAALDREDVDPESGQPHVAHVAACMAILLDAMATGNLIDDRPVAGAAGKLIADMTEK